MKVRLRPDFRERLEELVSDCLEEVTVPDRYVALDGEEEVVYRLNAFELDTWKALPESIRRAVCDAINYHETKGEFEYGRGYDHGMQHAKDEWAGASSRVGDLLMQIEDELRDAPESPEVKDARELVAEARGYSL